MQIDGVMLHDVHLSMEQSCVIINSGHQSVGVAMIVVVAMRRGGHHGMERQQAVDEPHVFKSSEMGGKAQAVEKLAFEYFVPHPAMAAAIG